MRFIVTFCILFIGRFILVASVEQNMDQILPSAKFRDFLNRQPCCSWRRQITRRIFYEALTLTAFFILYKVHPTKRQAKQEQAKPTAHCDAQWCLPEEQAGEIPMLNNILSWMQDGWTLYTTTVTVDIQH